MQTIRLGVSEKIYKNLMWFLQKFTKDELQIIEEGKDYLSIQDYLKRELEQLDKGNAEFINVEQLEEDLEDIIRKHEA